MKFKINLKFDKVGLILLSVYIFMYYNANGVFLPEMLTSISLFAFIGYSILYMFVLHRSRYGTVLSDHTIWYGLFMLVSILTMLYSEDGINIGSGMFYFMLVSILVTFCMLQFIRDESGVLTLCWSYGIASFVLIIFLAITGRLIGTASNRLGLDIFGNANTFANLLMAATIYDLWVLICWKNNFGKRIVLILFILANIFALALSAGRKFFVIPFVFLYILLITRQDKEGKKSFFKYTALLIILGIATYYLIMSVPVLYDAIGFRMNNFIKGTIGTGQLDISSYERKQMRELALNGWLESPIFGHGFNSFKYLGARAMNFFSYSHCNYTELLYNGGIIYFICYYSFYIRLLIKANRRTNDLRSKSFAIALCISLLVLEYGCVDYESLIEQSLLCVAMQSLCGLKESNENNFSNDMIFRD